MIHGGEGSEDGDKDVVVAVSFSSYLGGSSDKRWRPHERRGLALAARLASAKQD